MDVVNVQFDSEQRKTIIAEFSAPQDVSFWENQGAVSIDDERYTEFKRKMGGATSAGQSSSTPVLKRAFSFLR
ncbi:hypothetical protein [Pseudomonas sp. 6D_7.1_Bac1]|uniref:hypothetical protein n=1 Tax=Pseudomonas sp. 6D_7.1_Bac1 TaxID=2971615 RepID=UPI0021C87AF2|nr:hypothetical protein [Pseudomonas sp. 6D_7.1_Bac1]MCU1750435.1 hypothetical protein [Pseudomonas sp. 6D_7.1_Bac1]